MNKSQDNSPDFAFPKEVCASAREELKEAMRKGESVKSLQAVIKIVIADNLISQDNAKKGRALIDSVSQKLPEPYSSLGLLLEARLLKEIYNADRWTYNQRSIPLKPVPDDIKEWSRDIFSAEVVSLIEKSRKGNDSAKEVSIAEIAPIITNAHNAKDQGLSIYDFMTIQSWSSLSPFAGGARDVIPFFEGGAKGNRNTEISASQLGKNLINENLAWHNKQEATQAGATMARYSLSVINGTSKDTRESVEKWIDKYKHTPWCAPFFLAENPYISKNDIKLYREFYNIVSEYLKHFPDAVDSKALSGMLGNMSAESVNITAPSQNMPGKEIECSLSFSNLDDFYLLALKVPESALEKNVTEASLMSGGAPAAAVRIQAVGEEAMVPSYIARKVTLPPLDSGVYALVASRNGERSGIIRNPGNNTTVSVMLVSRLSYFKTPGRKEDSAGSWLFVTDGANGAPVAGAKVKFTPAWNNKNWKPSTATSDKEGKVAVPNGSYNFLISSNKDILHGYTYEKTPVMDAIVIQNGSLFTDLSIYRPGDKMAFTGVVYSGKGQELKISPETDVRVILNDANYQEVDTLSLRSDKFGRFNGEFTLPSDGLLGSWSLSLIVKSEYVARTSFEVAEYKAPTFYIVTEDSPEETKAGDTISIRGEVRTYSGMPIADAKVKYDIKYLPCYWLRHLSGGNASYGGSVMTTADGKFVIKLPTGNLQNTPYSLGRYNLNITATNASGETQAASPISFSMGEAYRISSRIERMIEVGNNETLKASVGVYDMLDRPVMKTIFYKVISLPDSVKVAEGDFESGKFPLDFSKLSSGEYRALFSLDKEFKDTELTQTDQATFVIWRKSDKRPPIATPLWVPQRRVIVNTDAAEKVKIEVGSSYSGSRIYALLSDMKGVYEGKWLSVSDGIVDVPVKVPAIDNRCKVNFFGIHDLKCQTADVVLIPEIQTKGLEIRTESFRDRLSPGGKEEWKFSFTFDDNRLAGLPVMAVMSNNSLNALAPFNWAFDPYSSIYWNVPGRIEIKYQSETGWTYRPGRNANQIGTSLELPDWNTYGQGLYGMFGDGPVVYSKLMVRGTAKNMAAKAEASEESSADSAMAYQDAVVTVEDEAEPSPAAGVLMESPVIVEGKLDNGAASNESEKEDEMRDIECPLAFFMPDLITDANGIASLDFTVPNFNGSWQLQVMGYTSDLRGNVLTKEAVSTKPVMAQLNAPRFVRTGDTIEVRGTLYNNTPDAASLSGEIEIFNPFDGKILGSSKAAPEKVDAMGSRLLSVRYAVPSDMNMIGIRVYGIGEQSKDGEQTIVPVYPSSSPVIESAPFWLAPGEKLFTMNLPKERENGVVTLSYTDNPVWECVTALPSILNPDSQNVLSQSDAFYATAVASGLISKYPSFKEAIKFFSDPENKTDSTLVSNLEKNKSLKVVALNNTPWVRDAQSQTMRLASLIDYVDSEKSRKSIENRIAAILKLQNGDGGWSWCDGMPSSEWISMVVVNRFSMLRSLGFLPKECEGTAKKGIKYIDSEIVKDWKRIGASKYSYISLLDYLYIRSSWKNIATSGDFTQIKGRALKEIEKEWKSMDIYDKATAAVLLKREGRSETATLILKSLGQYSSSSREKGMWFDNLKSGFRGRGKLLTTARVLEAWKEISPAASEVDMLRQWLLLSKQVEDWGDGGMTATLVQTILESGSDWTSLTTPPEIYVNNERMEVDHIATLTGSLTLSLEGKTGELRIKREAAGPAWGGVVEQYVAPIVDVKQVKTPQLSVSKNLYVITNDENGTTASTAPLKIGDRVRVTLTLKADRDLQYVVVNDGRSACLEPADQTSGYSSSDGVWMYREVRNSVTNLFIPFLSKGVHVISYDCYVDREGDYTLGIATAQSQYAPVITSHSAGELINVK